MNKITIGIPKALLYYKYKHLWLPFFEKLGCKVIISPATNKEILNNGIKYSTDEACMALKIFLGHVNYLQDKCDYIFIPRLQCLKKHEMMCTNFYALYDIVRNTFNTSLLHYNIDLNHHQNERKAFLDLGKQLNFSKKETLAAYNWAKLKEEERKKYLLSKQQEKLNSPNIKILLAGHPYNLYDSLLGGQIKNILTSNNIEIFYSDIFNNKTVDSDVAFISKNNYWTYNREIMAAIHQYENKMDGIILITSFPCGPDSLSNEMILRNVNIPITNLIIDEINSDTGLLTRIESFIDILEERRQKNGEEKNY